MEFSPDFFASFSRRLHPSLNGAFHFWANARHRYPLPRVQRVDVIRAVIGTPPDQTLKGWGGGREFGPDADRTVVRQNDSQVATIGGRLRLDVAVCGLDVDQGVWNHPHIDRRGHRTGTHKLLFPLSGRQHTQTPFDRGVGSTIDNFARDTTTIPVPTSVGSQRQTDEPTVGAAPIGCLEKVWQVHPVKPGVQLCFLDQDLGHVVEIARYWKVARRNGCRPSTLRWIARIDVLWNCVAENDLRAVIESNRLAGSFVLDSKRIYDGTKQGLLISQTGTGIVLDLRHLHRRIDRRGGCRWDGHERTKRCQKHEQRC